MSRPDDPKKRISPLWDLIHLNGCFLITTVSLLLGGLCLGIGLLADVYWLKVTGIVLAAPHFLGGIFLGLVVIPMVIIANRRLQAKEKDFLDK